MNWPTPLDPAEINGKQTLTGSKPITKLFRAGKELQDMAITSAIIVLNGKSIPCAIVGNTLNVDGTIESIKSENAHSGKLKCITGIKAALTVSGTTLHLTLSLSGKELDLSTMEITDATFEDVGCSISGVEC